MGQTAAMSDHLPPADSETDEQRAAAQRAEIVLKADSNGTEGEEQLGSVSEPAKVMRIGTMIRQLLEEVRTMQLDEPGRDRLREIYETSVSELASTLSSDLRDELARLALPFSDDEVPSDAELRVAQAQLVGWLEGLFHGIQATLFAQQMAARQQLEQMKPGQQLTPGRGPMEPPPGTYL
jgi:hypothetical protein